MEVIFFSLSSFRPVLNGWRERERKEERERERERKSVLIMKRDFCGTKTDRGILVTKKKKKKKQDPQKKPACSTLAALP